MQRLDLLSENELTRRISALRQAVDEVQTAQRASSASVVVNRIATGNNIDFTVTSDYHVVHLFETTVTPVDAAYKNSNFLWHVFYNVITTSGTGSPQIYTETLPQAADGTRKLRFYLMGMSSSSTVTYGVRVVVYMMGKATISVSQIS